MSNREHFEYVNKNISYSVSQKEIDGDDIIDIVITLKDKSNSNKAIGYIGTRLVRLYSDPSDTFVIADSLDAILGLEIGFLLETDKVQRFYNDKIRRGYRFNYIGRTYQFDLLPEYQDKGIEEYFIDNLGPIIQERKKNIWLMASTFYIAGTGCDETLEYIDFCRKRAFEAPISEESFSRCDRLIEEKWQGYDFAYVNYASLK